MTVLFDSKVSEEDALALIRRTLKQAPYTSKYPNKTIEDYRREVEAQFSRPVYVDDNFVNFVHEVLGYKKEDIKMITTGKIPSSIIPPRTPLYPGDQDIDFDNLKKIFGYTTVKENYISQVERSWKKLRNRIAEMNKRKAKEVDWKAFSAKFDADVVADVKADYEAAKALYRPLNFDAITKEIDASFAPLSDKIKDRLFDGLETVKEATQTLELETPLTKLDANGVPVCDFDKDFLDQFAPEIRDEVIEEIETDNWDAEYLDERRQVKLNLDTLLSYNASWRQKEFERQDQAFQDELSVAASVTEDAKIFQKMYLDVVSLARKNVELENEVQSLKYAIMEQESEKAKTEVQSEANKEEEEMVNRYLMKYMNFGNIKKEFPGVKSKSIPAKKVEEDAAH